MDCPPSRRLIKCASGEMNVRRIATFFLVALFAARSLLPMGMMLQATPASGGVQVVICTATGTKLVTLNSEGKPVTENGDVDRRGSGEDATKICPLCDGRNDGRSRPALFQPFGNRSLHGRRIQDCRAIGSGGGALVRGKRARTTGPPRLIHTFKIRTASSPRHVPRVRS